MTVAEINALTLEDVFHVILPRVLDLSGVPAGEPAYMINQDDTDPFYDRIILNKALLMPTEQMLNDELAEYKQELLDAENARVAEENRVNDIKTRFAALTYVGSALDNLALSVPSLESELQRIIDEDDQARLTALEAEHVNVLAGITSETEKMNRKDLGRRARELCNEVLDIIGGHNVQNALDGTQLDSLTATYTDILTALQQARPLKAKSLIQAVTPDGTLVTQAMKDEVLAAYTAAGL